jgi:hypothetical protein
MNTVVISFRAHKNLKSWLEYAGKGFSGGGELLRLIVTNAAYAKAQESKGSRLVDSLLGFRPKARESVGDTTVYAARLPEDIAHLIRDCAARDGLSTSDWCAQALMSWWQAFRELDEQSKGWDGWPLRYAAEYRALVTEKANVYAQKATSKG